jgi:hypothetical protein
VQNETADANVGFTAYCGIFIIAYIALIWREK